MVDETTCTKCGGELDTKGYPLWCRACQASYRRDYQALRKEMSESRGFALGASRMRESVCEKLYLMGGAMVMAHDVARFVREMELPVAKS